MAINFKTNFLIPYLYEAPLPLALERSTEALIIRKHPFKRPILDIGCGEGLFAKILFQDKIDTGIDPNANELKKAKEYGAYEELLECFGDAIPKPSGSFNTIISNSVMEHIPDLESVLKESYRLLSDDGFLYLTVPTDNFEKFTVVYQLLNLFKLNTLAQFYSKRVFNVFWKHYHCYDPSDWEKIFKRNGFKIEYIQLYGSKFLCMLNNILALFCFISYVIKKVTNRWFLFKNFRKKFAPILAKAFNWAVIPKTIDQGGLVFFKLKKVNL